MGPLMLQDKPHATASGCRENRSLGPHVRSTIRQSSGRGRPAPGPHVRGSASQEWRHGTRRRPRDMPLVAKRSHHVAVVIREARVGRVIAVSPRQQRPVVVAILVALALLWATGSLGADDADRRRWWRGCSGLLAERRGEIDVGRPVGRASSRTGGRDAHTCRDSRTTRPPDSGRRCTAGGGRRPSKRKRPPAPPSVTPIRLKLHYSYCLGQSRRRSLASIPSRRPSHAVGNRGSTPWPGRHRRVPPARRPDTRRTNPQPVRPGSVRRLDARTVCWEGCELSQTAIGDAVQSGSARTEPAGMARAGGRGAEWRAPGRLLEPDERA